MDVSVRYIVDDVDAAIEFYRDRLGFDVEMHPAPGFARFPETGCICCSTHRAPVVPGGPVAERSPAGWNRVQLTVDDLQAAVDDLEQAGVTFRGQLVEGQGGKQTPCRRTPSGDPIELFEAARKRLGNPVGEFGSMNAPSAAPALTATR